jgi:transcriptional regulator with PAS, ATPase and Fis domain
MKLHVKLFVLFEESGHHYKTIWNRLMEDNFNFEIIQVSQNSKIDPFSCDIALYTIPFIEPIVREKCLNPNAIFYNIGLPFDPEKLEVLKSIERGTDVLLIGEGKAILWDSKLTLKHYGIDNINFIPYSSPNQHVNHVKTAVYMGIKTVDLPQIERYIDIGGRMIHPFVIRKIGEAANLSKQYLDKKLKEYISNENKVMDYTTCISLSTASEFTEERISMLNLFDFPAVILANQETIAAINNAFRNEFHFNYETIIGNKIYSNALISELLSVCDPATGNGIWHAKSGKSYNVQRKCIETIGVDIIHRELVEIVPLRGDKPGNTTRYGFNDIIAKSQAMKSVISQARKLSAIDVTVLIEGESGTGKELLAQSIHSESPRSDKPFIAVNCGSFSESLLESELFGYAGGSFTGAKKEGKKGLLEAAHGGTIFLDEIAEATLKTQVRLLRFLQEKEVQPIGSNLVKRVDVRVICAANTDMEAAMHSGTIREDLFYRISPITLNVPPLRNRREDIEPLLRSCLGSDVILDSELLRFMVHYNWPGNVRELKGLSEYLRFFGGQVLSRDHLPERYQKKYSELLSLSSQPLAAEEGSTLKTGSLPMVVSLEQALLQLLSVKSTGRRALVQSLRQNGTPTTEYEVKILLDRFKSLGWIEQSTSGSASKLTELGRKQLPQHI